MNNGHLIFLRSAMLQKRAGILADTLKFVGNKATDLAGALMGNMTSTAAVALPASAVLAAWLAHKATSPKAVADLAPEYAMNAMEKETLVQSLRDLQDSQVKTKLKGGRRRVHDQFL